MHHMVYCRIQQEKWRNGKSPNRLENKCMRVKKMKEKVGCEEQTSTLIFKICPSLTNEAKGKGFTDRTN